MSIVIQRNQPIKSLTFKNKSVKNVSFRSEEPSTLEKSPKQDEYEKKGLSKGAKFAIFASAVVLIIATFNFKNIKKLFEKSKEAVKPEPKPTGNPAKPSGKPDEGIEIFEPDVVDPKKLNKKFLDLLEKKEIESFTFKEADHTIQVRNEEIIYIMDKDGKNVTHYLEKEKCPEFQMVSSFKNTLFNIQRKDKKALTLVEELKIKDNEHLYTADEISKYIKNRNYPQRKDAYAEGGSEKLYILSDNSKVNVTKLADGTIKRSHKKLDGTTKTSIDYAEPVDGIIRIRQHEDANNEVYKFVINKADGTSEVWRKCDYQGNIVEPTVTENGNLYNWRSGEENFWSKRIIDPKIKEEKPISWIIKEEKDFDKFLV